MELPTSGLDHFCHQYYPRRGRLSRHLRPTRSMSDENDWLGGRGKSRRPLYSTESTESERQHHSLHYPSETFLGPTKSTFDLRTPESYRRGRYVCRWHRSSPLRQYANSRVSLMRRSKSLGRPCNMAFISSSSNDEGISKAYFQRLQKRGRMKEQFPPERFTARQRFSGNRGHFTSPLGVTDHNSGWEQDAYKHDERKVE